MTEIIDTFAIVVSGCSAHLLRGDLCRTNPLVLALCHCVEYIVLSIPLPQKKEYKTHLFPTPKASWAAIVYCPP